MTRMWLVLLAACGDAVPEDSAHTCVVTRTDDFGSERWVSTMFEPGKPTRMTWYRDEIAQAHWDFTYDEAARVVAIAQDIDRDGIADVVTTYEHTPTKTVEHAGTLTVEHTIDANDRVTMSVDPFGAVTYELGADGEILRSFTEGADADTREPYSRLVVYRHANGRLVEETITDSRQGQYPPVTYAYEERPQQLVVTTTKQWIYTYDGEGRAVRAEEISGSDVWTKELVYGADGSVVVTGSRDGPVTTTTLSGACGFRPSLPAAPHGMPRPGTRWMLGTPSLPSPY